MSFSQSVKKEILTSVRKIKGCCATAFLTAVMKAVGSLCLEMKGYCFAVDSDNGDLLMFCSNLCQTQLGVGSAVYQILGEGHKNKCKYSSRFDGELGQKLSLTEESDGFVKLIDNPKINLKKDCCHRAFLQGLFCACGSVTIPEDTGDAFAESTHSNYHLEMRFSNTAFADFVQQEYPEWEFRQTQRKNGCVLYLKDSNKIADFFVFVDAINAKFTVENTIISRSFRNRANRQRNCIDSNIDKSVAAASRQLEAIQKIRSCNRFEMLPQQLREMAVVREENPEANLAELAALLGISKSGVNHRLTKLLEFADLLSKHE